MKYKINFLYTYMYGLIINITIDVYASNMPCFYNFLSSTKAKDFSKDNNLSCMHFKASSVKFCNLIFNLGYEFKT